MQNDVSCKISTKCKTSKAVKTVCSMYVFTLGMGPIKPKRGPGSVTY